MEEFLRFELLHVMYGEPADVMTTLYAGFEKKHLSRLLLARFVEFSLKSTTLKSTNLFSLKSTVDLSARVL